MNGEMRLQKYLSRAGAASRREAERLMLAGRVRVNGEVAAELGIRVTPEHDRIEVDGRRVSLEPPRWIAFNKPVGVLTTRHDPQQRATIYAYLPRELKSLKYLGRLDMDTGGLLLMSNQGDLVHRLLHPSSQVEREYQAHVSGVPGPEVLAALCAGVELDDGPARARRVRIVGSGPEGAVLRVVLTEGRNREVRRLLYAVGHPVERLERVRFGPIELGELESGLWRELTPREVEALEAMTSEPEESASNPTTPPQNR